jgi:excisionase family DNA binding protein
MNTDEGYLTAVTAAEYLSIHRNTLYRWTQMGLIKAHRIGVRGDLRYRRQDLDKFVEERTDRGHP